MEKQMDVGASGRPIQVVSWNDKFRNNKEWFKQNINYNIKVSGLFGPANFVTGGDQERMTMLYQVYNNKFPETWFKHVTDPLSAQNPLHKNFPAKIRPVTILRTNLDLLMAEYPRRPFIFQVNNLGEDGYNEYTESLNKKIDSAVDQYFKLALQRELMEQGLLGQDGQPVSDEAKQQVEQAMQNVPQPESIQEEHNASYRDKICIQAQKWLNRTIREHNVKSKLLQMFKDWLIVGSCRSYKAIEHDNIVYERISPRWIRTIKSPNMIYDEDGEITTVLRMMTVSDIVDRFYEDLKEEDIHKMESGAIYTNAYSLYTHLSETYGIMGLISVWHTVWTGKKKIGLLTRFDPETFQVIQEQVDEDYKVDKQAGETVEWMWVNEKYEGWRIGNDMYIKMQPIPVQRNAMNNFSYCKSPYNGRNYSDTESDNLSVMEIGIPFQILYIIVTRTLELTIAKSKGKILLLDQNTIPREDGWDEEKFFYYGEALGYFLIDRNQQGVDKSWNQYQVLDMTLFDSIQQLIQLQDYFKQQWDDIIGINRQRKGQTYASDAVGVNERATFQSTVITDMIFNLFEEFVEKELQGLLDLSKFTNASGVRRLWYDTEVGNEVINIDADTYCNAELGIFVESSTEARLMKQKVESTIQAMIQNNVKPSTVLGIIQSSNISELKAKLARIEELQAQSEQATAQNEQEAQKAADDRAKDFAEYNAILDTMKMNEEYDRKEDLEMIKGEFATLTFQNGDSNNNGEPDVLEVEKHKLERDQLQFKREQAANDRQDRITKQFQDVRLKQEAMKLQAQQHNDKMAIDRKKLTMKPKSK